MHRNWRTVNCVLVVAAFNTPVIASADTPLLKIPDCAAIISKMTVPTEAERRNPPSVSSLVPQILPWYYAILTTEPAKANSTLPGVTHDAASG